MGGIMSHFTALSTANPRWRPHRMAYSRTDFECGVTCCDETHCGGCVFGTHMGLEIGHGDVLAFRVARTPFGEEADGETAEHTQDPDGVAVADAALILVE